MNRFQTLLSISACAATSRVPERGQRARAVRVFLQPRKESWGSSYEYQVVSRHLGSCCLARGRAVQVAPMKPTFKPPGSKRLKLEHENLLSKIAFNFNLRRYNVGSFDIDLLRSSLWWSDVYHGRED
jgi:hypothetical protein